MKIKGQTKCQRPVLIIVGCFRIAGKDLHEVSINTRVSDMRILHIDTPARLLEREHSCNVNFSGKLQYKRKQQLILDNFVITCYNLIKKM